MANGRTRIIAAFLLSTEEFRPGRFDNLSLKSYPAARCRDAPFSGGFTGVGGETPGVNLTSLLEDLALLSGAENLFVDPAPSGLSLPGGWDTRPLAIIVPRSVAEVAEIVRRAEAEDVAILPCGGGTQLQTGYPPRAGRPYLLLSTAHLDRVLDYQPDDLTVTCEPGVTLAALQEILATHRQRLALDPPLPHRATLGGIVAANATGFWRPAYGAPRDLLIGMRAVMTGGKEVKGGGKVVKNVAGYDLCKLFTGAWGTLGVLTELTFKVRPLSEADRALAWEAPDVTTAARIGLELHHAQLAPTCLLATNEPEGCPRLIVGLQGTAERVTWQESEFARQAAAAGLNTPAAPLAEPDLAVLRDRQARLEPETLLAARIACLPTDAVALVQTLENITELALTVHCATGILHLAASAADPSLIETVTKHLPAGANLLWTRLEAPLPDRERIPIWGETCEDYALQYALKQSLDPRNTFSPGRFLGQL
jgi:glycolate oxidase FAD binding subunit